MDTNVQRTAEQPRLAISKQTRGDLIRKINDRCRVNFTGCAIAMTPSFRALDDRTKTIALHHVRTFEGFGHEQSDEHDFAFFDISGQTFFFRFDYFARNMRSSFCAAALGAKNIEYRNLPVLLQTGRLSLHPANSRK